MKKLLLPLALCVGLAWAGQVQAADGRFGTIEAQRIVLKDSAGRDRIVMSVDEETPEIIMFSEDGEALITLTAALGGVIFVTGDGVPWFATGNSATATKEVASALYATAYLNCEGYLTDNLIRTSCLVTPGEGWEEPADLWRVSVATDTQPSWNYHIGAGRFSVSDGEVRNAYRDAGDNISQSLINYAGKHNYEIHFTIKGYDVGTYRDGEMTLKGE